MGNQVQPNTPRPPDEIDLGQLIRMIGNGFKKLGRLILQVFVYFKKNALILLGLAILGIAISLLLNTFIAKKMKTEAIVRPNFDSKDYVYDVVDEIEANISARDTTFFREIGIDINDLKGFEVEIEAIEETEEEPSPEKENLELQYLELLQNFKDEGFVLDILRSEISEKSVQNHRVKFLYKNANTGAEISKKLLDYLNTNEYFEELRTIYQENAKMRVAQNRQLIEQIDELVSNYSKSMGKKQAELGEGTVLMENENGLNLPGLLTLKSKLVKEIEEKKVELVQQTGVFTLVNLGKPQEVKKPFFNQRIVAIPIYLILAFFVLSFLKYLDRKAKEMQL